MSAPKMRGIVCSADEVRGLLSGHVSLLVRPMKPQPARIPGWTKHGEPGADDGISFAHGKSAEYTVAESWVGIWESDIARRLCHLAKHGDRVWVREAFLPRYFTDDTPAYRADWNGSAADVCEEPSWRSATQMTREHSRLTLGIESVRVARVQDITEEEAEEMGGFGGYHSVDAIDLGDGCIQQTLRLKTFWNRWHGKRYPWMSNPWIWLIGVSPVEPA